MNCNQIRPDSVCMAVTSLVVSMSQVIRPSSRAISTIWSMSMTGIEKTHRVTGRNVSEGSSEFYDGGGENRTLVWKPSPKESTYLAASLLIRPRAAAEAAKNCAQTMPEEFRSPALTCAGLLAC